jgi:hypothetical protein
MLPTPPMASAAASALSLSWRPRAVGRALTLALVLLVAASLASNWLARARGGWVPNIVAAKLSLTQTHTLPLLFTAGLLAATAGLLALCAGLAPRGSALRWRWALSALGFAALAVDETTLLHTAFGPLLRGLAAQWGVPPAWQAAGWLLVAGLIVTAWVLLWLPALAQLPPRLRRLGPLGAALYAAGVAGGVLFTGWLAAAFGAHSLAYLAVSAVPTVLALAGLVLLIAALAQHLCLAGGALTWHPRPARVAAWLFAMTAVLVAAYASLYLLWPPRDLNPLALELLSRLNLDLELSVPNTFNGYLLGYAALLLGLITGQAWRTAQPLRWRWLALTAAFACLAADEFLVLHEILAAPVKRLLGVTGLLGFGWYIPVLPLVALLGLYCLPLLARLPRRTQVLFVAAGLVYVGAAIGVEMVGALFSERYGQGSFPYLLEVTAEEGLEMTGAVLFIYALLDYVARRWGAVRLDFNAAPVFANVVASAPASAPANAPASALPARHAAAPGAPAP